LKKRTQIQKLLVSGFLFVAILMVIMEVVAVREINILADQTVKMYRHPLTVSKSILEANLHIISMHRYMKDVALSETATEMEVATSRVDEDEKEVYRHFKTVMDRFLGDKVIVIEARKIFSDWKPIRSKVIELSRIGKHSDAAAITKGEGSRHVVLITNKMEELKDFAEGKAADFLSESKVSHATSILELRFLMAALLISAGVISFFVIKRVNSIEKNLSDSEGNLRRVQKMEALGELTGGIAHDFNNILGIISGNLELLRRKAKDDPKAIEYVEEAYNATQRGASLTSKLLGFSRKDSGLLETTNLNETIKGMENLIAKSLTSRVTVEVHLADKLWGTNIDPKEFEDAFLNLSLNARDAMPEGGTLTVETFNKVLDENYANFNPGSVAGEYVLVTVSDTGTGMDSDIIDKAFQPFFTTV